MENIIKKAHDAITRIKGKEYAPNSTEIQDYIDKQITMAQQTAVEWFCNKLSDLDTRPKETLQILEWYEQAKQMEKEQIVKAYEQGTLDGHQLKLAMPEFYYKETYKK